MRSPAHCLATLLLLAVAVRAASAQYYAPPANPPAPPAQAAPPLPPEQRYPLPPVVRPQAAAQNVAPVVAPPPAGAVNQSLRYPLPDGAPGAAAQAQLAAEPPVPQPVLFAPGQIMARVGDKTILYCDVAPTVNMIMAPLLAKAKSDAEREAIESYRDNWTRNVLDQQIQNKMLLCEFERGMPSEIRKDAKKRTESEGKMRKQIRTAFDMTLQSAREKVASANAEKIEKLMREDPTSVRLALLMKEQHLETQGELDLALKRYGGSLDQQVRDFGEYMMGMEAARNKLGIGKKRPQEVTHQEMLDYYREHVAEYQIPAKVRFEVLTARFSRFGNDKAAAWNFLAQMGNEVFLGGVPFPAVARKHSQEPHAQEGGFYDWVTPGSLASKPLDRAVFSLEIGKLSQPIEDDDGYHIVRVIERQEAGQMSFQEMQPKIKEAIEAQRRTAEQQKYLTNLRATTKVWKIYDEPDAMAAQPSGTKR